MSNKTIAASILSGTLFIFLLCATSVMQLQMKPLPQVLMLIYGGFLFGIMATHRRDSYLTPLFYILLLFLVWISFMKLMLWIDTFEAPPTIALADGRTVNAPSMNLSGFLYGFLGLIVAPVVVAIYHSTIRPSHRLETLLAGAFTVLTLIFLIIDLV